MSEPGVQHLSIRVPWHDTGYTGHLCGAPSENAWCLALPRIHETRLDSVEDDHAGKDWEAVPSAAMPPCVRERVGFLRDREFRFPVSHPYTGRGSKAHDDLKSLELRFPAYSAPCIPFRWMRRERAEEIADEQGIDYQPELEDQADELIPFPSGWVQHGTNQRAMLEGFFAAIRPPALAFFYAKRVPLTEKEGRVLIGVGRVEHIAKPQTYGGDNPLGTVAWECMVQHSVRPDFSNGFLLPYHEALAATDADPSLDLEDFVAFAPDDAWLDFSYASERVSHDAAITSLVAFERALRHAAEHLPTSRNRELQWASDRLGELWKLRGPCPGLGSALQAFGVQSGTLVVRKLEPRIPENGDPWELIEQAMEDPHGVVPGLQKDIGINLRRKWKALNDERRALLKLISRFELTPEQAECWYQPDVRAEAGIDRSDADVLANPYLLYEDDRYSENPISVRTVDHGAFPAPAVREAHPLPEPSAMEDPLDVRRARAVMIEQLERAAANGDTLSPASRVLQRVKAFELDPPCPLDHDQLLVYGKSLEPVIHESELADGTKAFQLDRLLDVKTVIQKFVERRQGAPPHEADIDWRPRLDAVLDSAADDDPDEETAREEKVAALEELFASRMSVLIGPAGTGKTTLLKVLCDEPSVHGGNVLLLAPTGKARVRLGTALERDAKTIAQFLLPSGRYVPETGQYRLSTAPPEDGYSTVIIDESSMLTEEQLAAVIDGVKSVARFILVGDPRQLPPIGAGRPFVDIVNRVRPDSLDSAFPRRAQSCAELTVPRRTTRIEGVETNQAQRRADLMLAEWFSGREPSPGADVIWDGLGAGQVDDTLTVLRWDGPDDLRASLLEVLRQELKLKSLDDVLGFELACGGSEYEGRAYFWRKKGDQPGAAEKIEDWQILAPVRGHAHGVRDLNRFLQRHFRESTREWARSRNRKIPKPLGGEEILWGDKVISVVNESWRNVFPRDEGTLRYIANGDIGVVVGQYKTQGFKGAPWQGQVEFAGQEGYVYDYKPSHFGDEGSPPLELAYALTVHKAQGSEFGRTIVIVPNPCRILTRELLYTALTRQRERVTLLYQGDPNELKKFAEPERSETALRLTNLFSEPDLVETKPGTFLEKGLIHTTSRGDVVRSKSEALIAELLHARKIEYAYERKLTFDDGSFRYPDFTIEDDDLGRTIFWEHLGMLKDSVYAKRWEAKRKWYADHGVVEYPALGNQIMVSSEDDPAGGINNAEIAKVIDELFG